MFYNPFVPALSRNDMKHYPCEFSSKLLSPVQTGNVVNTVRNPKASLRYNADRIAMTTAEHSIRLHFTLIHVTHGPSTAQCKHPHVAVKMLNPLRICEQDIRIKGQAGGLARAQRRLYRRQTPILYDNSLIPQKV